MSAEVQPLPINIMLLFYRWRRWSSQTQTLIFLSFSGLIFWCANPSFQPQLPWWLFFLIHTEYFHDCCFVFCCFVFFGWFSLQGMQFLFCLRVLLWCAGSAACLLTARGGCYRLADGTHNSITSACSSASCLTLFHTTLLFPHSPSLFSSFHPSLLSLAHFPPLSTSISLLPPVFVSRTSVCEAVRASVSASWEKDAAAKGGLG